LKQKGKFVPLTSLFFALVSQSISVTHSFCVARSAFG